jgi:uncharacterized protein DUF4154
MSGWTRSSRRRCVARSRTRRATRLVCVLLTALTVGGSPARALAAGGVDVSALKAAFLYNFAKFSEWPADVLAPGQRIGMCVVGDAAVADALTQTIKGHEIVGHELMVAVLKPDESATACHLLYVSASEVKRSAALLVAARGAPVFTVSDGDQFAESGGVAQLIVENDRMRFAINIASAQRGRLAISSKLLSLATIVKDDPNVRGR